MCGDTAELAESEKSARCLLLGLPNLKEFKHPAMILALEQIIKDGKTERVSAIPNLYIDGKVTHDFDRIVKSSQVVINHLGNYITKIDITNSPRAFSENVLDTPDSRLPLLTHLTVESFTCYAIVTVPIIKAVGGQLTLIDIFYYSNPEVYNINDAIKHCSNLHIFHVEACGSGKAPGCSAPCSQSTC